jgi:hypothetical protein
VGGNHQEIVALVKVNRMVAAKHLYLLFGCMVTSSTEFQQGVSNCTSKGPGTIFYTYYVQKQGDAAKLLITQKFRVQKSAV